MRLMRRWMYWALSLSSQLTREQPPQRAYLLRISLLVGMVRPLSMELQFDASCKGPQPIKPLLQRSDRTYFAYSASLIFRTVSRSAHSRTMESSYYGSFFGFPKPQVARTCFGLIFLRCMNPIRGYHIFFAVLCGRLAYSYRNEPYREYPTSSESRILESHQAIVDRQKRLNTWRE